MTLGRKYLLTVELLDLHPSLLRYKVAAYAFWMLQEAYEVWGVLKLGSSARSSKG